MYNPGQLRQIAKWIPDDLEWFVLGGPADADEAQTMHALRPDVKIFGAEPDLQMRRFQENLKFPGVLTGYAISDINDLVPLTRPGSDFEAGRRASIVREMEGSTRTVPSRTLDRLAEIFGPWRNVFLWLDIEGAELLALQGATTLLRERRIVLANLEVHATNRAAVIELLDAAGLRHVDEWNSNGGQWSDCVFKLEPNP